MCWFGLYLAGGSLIVLMGMYWLGFSHNPVLFVLMPLSVPGYLYFLLPESWSYALFEHLPASVAASLIHFGPYGVYLLHLTLSMSAKRLQTFCVFLVLLLFLLILSAFGEFEFVRTFPRPD